MDNKKYNIENFYVGELYIYTNFANFTSRLYNPENQEKINRFSQSRAIKFQTDELSKYIDWEKGIEYTGFLTLFYKHEDKYICLHDGITYNFNSSNYIKNIISLSKLLPQINTKISPVINIEEALKLFDILFKNNNQEYTLYNDNKNLISNYYIGNITIGEIITSDNGYEYLYLPQHIMLNKQNLAIESLQEYNQIKTTYKCLFIEQGSNLYNINNSQYYNPNIDNIDKIISFNEYLRKSNISIQQELISIPKSLKLFKRTI